MKADERSEFTRDPVFRAAQLVLAARLIAVVLVVDPSGFDTFVLPKSVAAHLFSALLVALLFWLYLRHGRELFRWSPIHVGVGLTLLVLALATPFALDVNIALFGAWKRYLGLTQMLDHAVLYAAAVTLVRSSADLARLGAAAGVATVGVLSYAVVQRFGLDPIKFVQGPTTRPISTLGNPDNLGGYLSVAAVTSFGIVLTLWGRLALLVRLGLAGLALACGVLLLSTGIRNGVLGVAGGLLAIALIIMFSPGSRAGKLAALGATTGAVVAAVMVSGLGARLTPAALAVDPAIRERFELWGVALQLVAAHPFLGLGPDNLVAGFSGSRTPEFISQFGSAYTETSTHDWGLYFLTSGGPAALLAVTFAIAAALAAALTLARRAEVAAVALVPLLAYLGQGLVDINDIGVDWMLWLSLGIIAGAVGVGGRDPVLSHGRPSQPRRLIGVVGLGVTALAVIGAASFGLPRVAASRAMNQSEGLIAIKAGADAAREGGRAITSDPRRAEYWSSLGSGLAQTNPLSAATAYSVAARREPWNPLHWKNLAVTNRAGRNYPGAVAAARRAVRTDPNDPELHALLATTLLDAGNFEAAASEGQRAIAGLPTERSFEPTILALIKLERWGDAVRVAQEAIVKTGSVHFRLRLAQAYTGGGQIAQAKEQLALVLAATPTDPEALDLKDFLASK